MVDKINLEKRWKENPFISIKENSEVFLSFFENYTDTVNVTNYMINIGKYHKGKNAKWKSLPIVNICFNFWKNKCIDEGFEEKFKIIKTKLGKRKDPYYGFRTNLNLFFNEHERINHKKIPLPTKKFIELCFEIEDIRKSFLELSKIQDIFMAFENIVKYILFFLIKETPRFKELTQINALVHKRKKFVYGYALPIIKNKVHKYFFNRRGNNAKIRDNLIHEIVEIYNRFLLDEKRIMNNFVYTKISEVPPGFAIKGNKLMSSWDFHGLSKETEFIYVFHECDSKYSDILISLIEIFSDNFSKMLFLKDIKEQLEDIQDELTNTHGNKGILDTVRDKEITKLRIFLFKKFKNKSMLGIDEIKECILTSRKIDEKYFQKLKKEYIIRKIRNLLIMEKYLIYCRDKLEPSIKRKIKNKVRYETNLKDTLYPLPEKEYIKRWDKILSEVKLSDIIDEAKKVIL